MILVDKVFYGLKISGAAWRAMFVDTLNDMEYVPTKTDPDVWLKPVVKPNGTEYYKIMLLYAYNVIHLSHDIAPAMETLGKSYRLKDDTYGEPDHYLGANVKKVWVGQRILFTMQCDDYVKSSIVNLEKMLEEDGEDFGKLWEKSS